MSLNHVCSVLMSAPDWPLRSARVNTDTVLEGLMIPCEVERGTSPAPPEEAEALAAATSMPAISSRDSRRVGNILR